MARTDGRIEPGEPLAKAISARAWNRAQDAADLVLGDSLSVSAPAGQGASGAAACCRVMAKNTSGSTIPWMGGCQITGITPSAGASATGGANAQFLRSPTVTVAIPSSASTTASAAVALQPIKPGQCGWIAVAGVIQCKATISASADTRLSLAASTTSFASGTSGQLEILWKEGTGSGKLVLARFASGGLGAVLGKTSSAWSKGSSASIAVYSGTPGAETATGDTVTAFNKFAAIATGKFVALLSIGGSWYVVSAECS